MRAAFKVVPPASRELVVVEVGRPASYPNATSVSLHEGSGPSASKNVV